jgi:hypothetical protein
MQKLLKIECKSVDRVAVLTAMDQLNSGQVDQQCTCRATADYAIWCTGVDRELLEARLKKVCRQKFTVAEDDPLPPADREGRPMIGGGPISGV